MLLPAGGRAGSSLSPRALSVGYLRGAELANRAVSARVGDKNKSCKPELSRVGASAAPSSYSQAAREEREFGAREQRRQIARSNGRILASAEHGGVCEQGSDGLSVEISPVFWS